MGVGGQKSAKKVSRMILMAPKIIHKNEAIKN